MSRNPPIQSGKAGAGFAGAGGGTLLVLLANSLPNNSWLKPWLLLLAPTVTVIMSVTWLWIRVEIANYIQDKRAVALATRTKGVLEDALVNPHTSDNHKQTIRKLLEEVEMVIAERHISRLKEIGTISVSDILTLDKAQKNSKEGHQ